MTFLYRLNPCCSWTWTSTAKGRGDVASLQGVLILIVVDDGLVLTLGDNVQLDANVLILIVVDNGLVHYLDETIWERKAGLNPYCSGQWTSTGSYRIKPSPTYRS